MLAMANECERVFNKSGIIQGLHLHIIQRVGAVVPVDIVMAFSKIQLVPASLVRKTVNILLFVNQGVGS